jgi:arginine decarboxylase
VVISSQTENEIGKEAWAGIGWVTTIKKPTKGLFVEHQGGSKKEVETLIRESLANMTRYRTETYGEIQYEIVGVKCENRPVCAVVAAVYESQGWHSS